MDNQDETPLNTSPLTYAHCFDSASGRLDLSCRDLAGWPFAVSSPAEILTIDANMNRFRAFPDSLFACRNVRQLFFMGNQLVKIPDAIARLSSLKLLELSFNPIRHISSRIGELTQLRTLVVNGGCLEAVPDSIGKLAHLRTLSLGHELSVLPASLGRCRQLTRLTLSFNRLRALPASLGKLERLRELRVDHNRLIKVPPALGRLPSLRWLHADGNPLRTLPWFALEMPSLRGLSCCDFLVSATEAKRFTAACTEHGLVLLWNRSLLGSAVYESDATEDDTASGET